MHQLIKPDYISPNAKVKLLVDVHNISQEQRLLKLKHVSGKVLILHHLLHTAHASSCPKDKLDDLLAEFSDVLSTTNECSHWTYKLKLFFLCS